MGLAAFPTAADLEKQLFGVWKLESYEKALFPSSPTCSSTRWPTMSPTTRCSSAYAQLRGRREGRLFTGPRFV